MRACRGLLLVLLALPAPAASAETLASWPGTPRAIRASTAIEAARTLHDPKTAISKEDLAVHILDCMDRSARSLPPETDVLEAIRACVKSAKAEK